MAEAAAGAQGDRQAGWLRRAWRGFNRWRRKYWLTRVLILLLLFGSALQARLFDRAVIVDLVRISIQAIQYSSDPTLRYREYQYNVSREVIQLRYLILRELNAGPDDQLSPEAQERAKEVGLDVRQLELPSPQADLEQLAAAAKALAVVSPAYSTAAVRQEAYYAARATADEIIARQHREVEEVLQNSYRWPDYSKWATWRYGLLAFYYQVIHTALALGVGVWLFLCFLAGLGVSAQFQRRRLIGLAAGAATGVLLCWWSPREFAPLPWLDTGGWLYVLALLCTSAAAGLWAGGLAQGVRRKRLTAAICAVLGGAAVILSSTISAQGVGGYLGMALRVPPRLLSPWRDVNGSEPGHVAIGILLLALGICLAVVEVMASRWTRHRVRPS